MVVSQVIASGVTGRNVTPETMTYCPAYASCYSILVSCFAHIAECSKSETTCQEEGARKGNKWHVTSASGSGLTGVPG